MNVVSIIADLAEKDIRLWLEEGNLRYSAPDGAMTPELMGILRDTKADIIAFLQQSGKNLAREIPVADKNQPIPASFAQQRLWFLHKLDPANSAYHIHIAIQLDGQLDIGQLEHACHQIIQRHEILRTRYRQDRGKLLQVIDDNANFELATESLKEDDLVQKLEEERHRVFDLVNGPVFRLRLFQLDREMHVLSFTIHHIAADGWSLGIFVSELGFYYTNTENTTELPQPPRQYADYSAWQTTEEFQQELADQKLFWLKQLQGVPNISLPLDRPRTANTPPEGAHVSFSLDQAQTAQWHKFNKQQGLTPFMSMLACLSILLARYSQQDDFCIGTPVAGRNHAQLENLIGCFLNVLAIRCEPDPDQTLASYLQQLRQSCSSAFANQDIPFEHIVNDIAKQRDLSITPVFQVMLSVQNTPLDSLAALPELKASPLETTEPAAQFDLKLTVQENSQDNEHTVDLRFDYKKALFNSSTIEQLARHFQQLFGIVFQTENLDHKLFELDIFEASKSDNMNHLLGFDENGLNQTKKGLPKNLLLHRLFEAQVDKTPDSPAISDAQNQLTYAELDSQANSLANHLIALDTKPESLIGTCLYRSNNMSVALLASLKAACAYVPFDPDFPEDRLAFMADDTAIAVMLCDNASVEKIGFLSGKVKLINIDEFDFTSCSQQRPDIALANRALFNVIYTSGSTGKPKGVMVAHEGIANRLLWMQDTFPLTANDKVLQKTPYSFDVSVWELFWPLITGSQLVFAKPGGHKDPAYLRDLIQEEGITTMHFVPSMLTAFLATADIERCNTLSRVFCSGEALQNEHVKQFYIRLVNAELHNLYGPTEASIDVSWFACDKNSRHSSVPIGKPIANTQLHILDQNMNPLPAGIAGELYIGGIGLARGYLNRDELTGKTFLANPFTQYGHPSDRLYRSGDLARLGEDGEIMYMGRIDHQVKLRGNRIELGEIESALLKHDAVNEAAVMAYELDNKDTRLVAYLISDDDIDKQALNSFLAKSLPQSMIPSHYTRLDQWPLSPSGKLNRHKLPAPDFTDVIRQAYVAPATDTEHKLATIWSGILGIEKIGVYDNFFELGGHSLTATQALSEIQDCFNVEIPLREIFERPTIKTIARLVDEAIIEQSVYQNNDEEDEDSESFVI